MNIKFVERKDGAEQAYMAQKLPDARFDAPEHDIEALCVFVDSPVGPADMDHYPNLKLIATRSTGYDHIDIAEAARRNIAVATVPSYGAPTVAEFAFGLILALSRRVCDAHALVTQGQYSQAGLEGFDLAGKTLGLLGSGKIGAHMARIARGFGMSVLVYDVFHNDALAQEIGFTYADLPTVLGAADILSVHVPYTKDTHHLINESLLPQIKKGCYIINTARGAVVDTAALIKGLQDGVFAGAGLDVLEEEGDLKDEMHLLAAPHPKEDELKVLLENHYLIHHPRVIITPHIAFDTREAVLRILDTTAENIAQFFAGTPQNILKV